MQQQVKAWQVVVAVIVLLLILSVVWYFGFGRPKGGGVEIEETQMPGQYEVPAPQAEEMQEMPQQYQIP